METNVIVQDVTAANIDLHAIMHAGGWKSPDMVMRYIEHTDVQKSGMARLYLRLTEDENKPVCGFTI
jgi:hypothetical protein